MLVDLLRGSFQAAKGLPFGITSFLLNHSHWPQTGARHALLLRTGDGDKTHQENSCYGAGYASECQVVGLASPIPVLCRSPRSQFIQAAEVP